MKSLLSVLMLFFVISFLDAQVVGSQAKDFTLEKLGGGNVSLSDYAGEVIYIFWFGNACHYCININGPLTQTEVADKHTGENFQALGIDTWTDLYPSTQSSVGSFQAQTGITYPLLLDGSTVATEYGVTYDRSMVIDQEGVIRYYGGSHSQHDWPAINSKIDELLNITGIKNKENPVYKFDLSNNYPNPFNPSTNIPFSVNKTQYVKLRIFDVTGQLVCELVSGEFGPGSYEVTWNGTNLNGSPVSSGVYFSRLTGDNQSRIRRILLLK